MSLAYFRPHPPHSVASSKTSARRLFADCKAEELAYYEKFGDFPIMHVVAIGQDVVAEKARWRTNEGAAPRPRSNGRWLIRDRPCVGNSFRRSPCRLRIGRLTTHAQALTALD